MSTRNWLLLEKRLEKVSHGWTTYQFNIIYTKKVVRINGYLDINTRSQNCDIFPVNPWFWLQSGRGFHVLVTFQKWTKPSRSSLFIRKKKRRRRIYSWSVLLVASSQVSFKSLDLLELETFVIHIKEQLYKIHIRSVV